MDTRSPGDDPAPRFHQWDDWPTMLSPEGERRVAILLSDAEARLNELQWPQPVPPDLPMSAPLPIAEKFSNEVPVPEDKWERAIRRWFIEYAVKVLGSTAVDLGKLALLALIGSGGILYTYWPSIRHWAFGLIQNDDGGWQKGTIVKPERDKD